MNKRKRTQPAHDNPIIAALWRSCKNGFTSSADVDRPPDRVLDLLMAWGSFKDATREIGALVVKALLTDDRQIVRIVKDALKKSDHFFGRDREKVLRKKVAKILPELMGLSIAARKREIEKRFNCGNELPSYRWDRLCKGLSLAKLPTGRPRKLGTKR